MESSILNKFNSLLIENNLVSTIIEEGGIRPFGVIQPKTNWSEFLQAIVKSIEEKLEYSEILKVIYADGFEMDNQVLKLKFFHFFEGGKTIETYFLRVANTY